MSGRSFIGIARQHIGVALSRDLLAALSSCPAEAAIGYPPQRAEPTRDDKLATAAVKLGRVNPRQHWMRNRNLHRVANLEFIRFSAIPSQALPWAKARKIMGIRRCQLTETRHGLE